jgi:hydrogenase expression/formation protein HypD
MLRVPGNQNSLLQAQSYGADVRIVYSPLDAVRLAQENPASQVVFFAVGFETTAPATALAVLQAHQLRLENFTVLSVHVRVLPAMQQIAQAPGCQVQGFLAAGHVCTVMGCQVYQAFVDRFQIPVVVTGFEPVDLLKGINECVRLLERDQPAVINAYPRSVRDAGNIPAQEMLEQVFQVADGPWRGLGIMPGGSLVLRPQYAAFDAAVRFPWSAFTQQDEEEICPSGQVMTGLILPPECPFFGTRCTPAQPLGAPMVSSEGACAAYFSYQLPDHQVTGESLK